MIIKFLILFILSITTSATAYCEDIDPLCAQFCDGVDGQSFPWIAEIISAVTTIVLMVAAY